MNKTLKTYLTAAGILILTALIIASWYVIILVAIVLVAYSISKIYHTISDIEIPEDT